MRKNVNKNKKGVVGIEYVIIGAIIILGALAFSAVLNNRNEENINSGTNRIADKEAHIIVQQGETGNKITALNVSPQVLDLTVNGANRQGRIITEIFPQNVWNYHLEWYVSDTDKQLFDVEPSGDTLQALVKAKKDGKGLIRVSTTDGSEISKDVIVRIGTPVSGFNISGNINIMSNEQARYNISFTDPNVTWNNKEIKLEVIEDKPNGTPTSNDTSGMISSKVAKVDLNNKSIIVSPKQGGTLRLRVTVTDLVFDKIATRDVAININQKWSEWSPTQTNNRGETNKDQYRAFDYNVWSPEYSTPLNIPGEVKLPNGKYHTALAGYENPLGYNPDPNNPLIKKLEQYRTKKLGSYSSWSKDPYPSNAPVKETSTWHEYQDVKDWDYSTFYTSPPSQFYTTGTQYRVNYAYETRRNESKLYDRQTHDDKAPDGFVKHTADFGEPVIPVRFRGSSQGHTNPSTGAVFGSNTHKLFTCKSNTYCPGWTKIGDYNNPGHDAHFTSNLNQSTRYRYFAIVMPGPDAKWQLNWGYFDVIRVNVINGTTGWQESSTAVPQGWYTGLADRRTVYYRAGVWGPWLGFRINQPYEKTTSRDVRSGTAYRYREWGPYTSWADCNGLCPASGQNGDTFTEVNQQYSKPIKSSWGPWQDNKITANNGVPGRLVETRKVYRYPLNFISDF